MNIHIIKRLVLCLVLLTMLGSTGCGDMDDIQKEFTQRGETIYTAKADSLKAFGGLNRIQLSWLLLSDPKIHKYKVFWNNRRDSVENIVERTVEIDTVELILDGLNEGTYHFEVYTYDKVGNSSVQASVIGKVYGKMYASSLLTRSYRKLKRVEGSALEIEWMTSDEQLAGVDLEYTDRTGELKSLKVPKNEEFTRLDDFPFGGSFQTKSAFLPEPYTIDTFYTAYSKVTIPTDTLQWSNYPVLFGHFGSLIAMQNNGELMQLDHDGAAGGFKFPRRISGGWLPFDTFFSHGTGGVVARLLNGGLRRYSLNANGTFGPTKTIGSGFHIFDLFFSYGNNLMGRKDNGELWKYPLDDNGNFGTASSISGTWDQYDKLLGSNNALVGRTPDGKLWYIPINNNGDSGAAVEIGNGWHRFDLIANYGNDLIARELSGELWHYPIDEDGSLGAPEQILIVTERL